MSVEEIGAELRAAGILNEALTQCQALSEEVTITLYLRMGTCLMHHPRDLPAYLEAWDRWKRMVA